MVTTKEFFYIRIFTLKLTMMLRKKNNIISHTLVLLALMAFLTACTASQSVSEQKRAEKAEQVSTVVQNVLNSKHFTLNVNNMYPVSASSKYVGGEFFLEVKNVCNLFFVEIARCLDIFIVADARTLRF